MIYGYLCLRKKTDISHHFLLIIYGFRLELPFEDISLREGATPDSGFMRSIYKY